MNLERTVVQPNPGKGVICNKCVQQLDFGDSDCPCVVRRNASLVRLSHRGQDILFDDVLNKDFVECCFLLEGKANLKV